MKGNNGSEQKSRGLESKHALPNLGNLNSSNQTQSKTLENYLARLMNDGKNFERLSKSMSRQGLQRTINDTNEAKQGSSDELSKLERSLNITLNILLSDLDAVFNSNFSLEDTNFKQNIFELIGALRKPKEVSEDLQDRIAAELYRAYNVILKKNIYGETLNGTLKELNDNFYYSFCEKKNKIKSLMGNKYCRNKYARYFDYVWEFNDALYKLHTQVNVESSDSDINKLYEDCDAWLRCLIAVIVKVKQDILESNSEFPNPTSSESILSIGEDIEESFKSLPMEILESLQMEINEIAASKRILIQIFNDVGETKRSLNQIRDKYKKLKTRMGQQRREILENLKLYVEFGVPKELASIDLTQEHFELDQELHELSRDISEYREDKKRYEKRLREIKKRIGALEVHVKDINQQKELIEKGYDKFECYYVPYANVLPVRGFSSRSRHQQLYDWSTKEREKERKSIIEVIRNKAKNA